MTKMKHDAAIYWPNGRGYTPCTQEYADKLAERDAIHDPRYGNLDDLSPADYNKYCKCRAAGMLENP